MPTSTEFTLGRVLVLVGAIVTAVSLVFVVGMMMVFMFITGGPVGRFPTPMAFSGVMAIMFTLMLFISVAGAVVGFMSWSRSVTDARKGGILGIVAAMLPPIGLFFLAGGILLLLSPEAKAQQEAAGSGHPPAPRY